MKLLLGALAALAAAVLLGQLLTEDPGMVIIGYRGTVLRTSLAVFVLLTALAGVALYLAIRLLARLAGLRGSIAHWSVERRRRRANQGLASGLLALAEGDYARAERLLARDAEGEAPAVHYLAAAQAAHAQQAVERRDTYLQLAADAAPEAALAVMLRRAEFALDQGELDAAEQALDALAASHGDSRQVFALRHRLYVARQDWTQLRELLPALRRGRVYSEPLLRAIEAETAGHLLAAPAPTLEEIRRLWAELPKATRSQVEVIDRYAADLIRAGANEEAEALLRTTLKRGWDPVLVARYGELEPPDPAKAVATAERWLAERPDDAALLLALGRLCLRAGLWGKARAYLEDAAARAPSPLVMQLLAEAHEQLGEHDAARRRRESGLALAVEAGS